jgi:hypothetical protein
MRRDSYFLKVLKLFIKREFDSKGITHLPTPFRYVSAATSELDQYRK